MDYLTPELIGLEGKRVEVVSRHTGKARRFWVSRSSGKAPCHIELKTRRSIGGHPADSKYVSIKVIDRGPR